MDARAPWGYAVDKKHPALSKSREKPSKYSSEKTYYGDLTYANHSVASCYNANQRNQTYKRSNLRSPEMEAEYRPYRSHVADKDHFRSHGSTVTPPNWQRGRRPTSHRCRPPEFASCRVPLSATGCHRPQSTVQNASSCSMTSRRSALSNSAPYSRTAASPRSVHFASPYPSLTSLEKSREYQTLTNRATQFSPTLGQVQQSTDKPSCVSRSIPPWTRTSQNFTTSIAPWARPKQESAHFDAPTALSQREQPVASQSALETASEVNASVAVNNISSAASPAEVDVSETANLELAQQLLRLGITADQVNQLNALLSTYANVENESLCYGATVPSDHQENASQTFFSSQSMSNSDVSRALHNTSEPMTPLPLTGSGRPFSHSDAQTPISSLPTPFQNLYHSSMSRLAQPSCHRSINIHEPNQTVQAAYITSRHVSDFVTNATPFFAPDTTTTTATTLQAHHQPLLSSLECGQSRSVFDVRSVASESQHPRTQNLTTQRSLDGTLYSGLERRCPNTSSYDLKTAIRNDADLRALPVGASLQPSVSSTAYQDAPYISNRKNSTSTYATPPDQRATLLSTAAATASHVSSVFFYPNTAVETAANSLAHCPRAPQPAALQAPWSLFEQHSARSSHILSPFLSLIPSDSCQQKSLSNALVQNATMLSSTRPVVKDPFATLMSPPSLPQVPRTSELDHTNFPRSDKPTMFLDPVKPCDPDRFSPNYTSLSLAEPVPTAKCEEEINVRPRSSPSSAPASSEQPVTANPRVPANGSVTALARPEKALPAPPPQVDNFFRQAASHAFTVQKFLKHPLSFDPIGLQRLISIFDIRKRDLRSGIVSRGRFAPEVSFQNSSEASFKLRGLGDIKPDVPTYPSLPSCIVVKRIQLTAAAYDHLSAEAQGYLIADTTGSAFLCLHNVFPNPNLSNNLPLKHQRRSWIFQSTIHPDGQLHPSDIIALENVTTQWITGNLVLVVESLRSVHILGRLEHQFSLAPNISVLYAQK